MNVPMSSNHSDLWTLAGWTMIHFLWLGTLIAVAALVCRLLLRRASPNIRYMTALACLAILAALPVAIATWIHQNPPPFQVEDSLRRERDRGGFVPVAAQETNPKPTNAPIIDLAKQEPPSTNSSVPPLAAHDSAAAAVPEPLRVPSPQSPAPSPQPPVPSPFALAVITINSTVHYLPWLWLIGTPITFALTATGIIGTRRLHRASRPITEGPIAEILAQLAASLRLGKRVTVAVCDRIVAPVLIGILRPIILLPPAALTGYSPDEIEMVLLHELAHVRRWDNLVNLMQRLLESLLFFHPAVWLISSWARREREACCDALVVTRTDRPHAYAELLVALAAQMPRSVLFHPAASSAMAAGPLRSRIRRILKLDDDPMLISGKSFTLVLAALALTATLAILYVPKIGQAEQSITKGEESAEPNRDVDAKTEAPTSPQTINRDGLSATAGKISVAKNGLVVLDGVTNLEFEPGNLPAEGVKHEKTVSNDARPASVSPETRAELAKNVRDLQGEIKHKYEAYLNIAQHVGRPQGHEPDPETDLLLHDIADTQAKVESLTTAYYQLQTDYMVAKSELSDPALLEAQADEAIKQDSQYAALQQQLVKAREASGDDSASLANLINRKIEEYRANFKKTTIREMQSKPNVPLQQLTQRFKTQAASLQNQIGLGTQTLEQKKQQLQNRLEKSVELETRGEELKQLQQNANDMNVKLEGLDIDAEVPDALKMSPGHAASKSADVARILTLFRSNGEFPDETRIYDLPASLEVIFPELSEVIETLKADPSHLRFSYNLTNSGTRLELRAPKRVHDEWFQKRISEWTTHAKTDPNKSNSNLPADVASLFVVSADNPLETRNYAIPDSLRGNLPSALYGLQNGPSYGPPGSGSPRAGYPFEYKVQDRGVAITAPKNAHDRFFRRYFEFLSAGLVGPRPAETAPQDDKASSSGDWPAGVAFLSPKEGEISIRAARIRH